MSRVTFITGASSGFGAGLARHFAQRGDPVALVARRMDRIETLAAEIDAEGGRAIAIECDVRDRDAVHRAVERCNSELGPVGLLIANAGVSRQMSATGFDATILQAIFEVNVYGAAYCIEAVLPDMLAARAGQIVGISSLASYNGIPGLGAYSASKAALSTLLESLRIELRPKGISVTSIHPGFVRTEMTRHNAARLPFLMELDEAVEHIVTAIGRHDSEYAFPWQTATISRLGRLLPNRLSDRLFAALASR